MLFDAMTFCCSQSFGLVDGTAGPRTRYVGIETGPRFVLLMSFARNGLLGMISKTAALACVSRAPFRKLFLETKCLLCLLSLSALGFLQWAAIALVGVLIDDSVLQLLLFCGLHSVMFFILVCLKPFANRWEMYSQIRYCCSPSI